MVSLSPSTAAMACPTTSSDANGEIVIGSADDEATVTAEGEADGGDEAIVTGESPVVDDDDIDDVVGYVIVHEVVLIGLEVVRLITCR